MSPGLPVIGLGALFCVISALAAPILELGRAARGKTSVASWLQVGRQFALAVAMIATFYVTLRLVYTLVAGAGPSEWSPGGGLALPSALIGMSVAVLAALLAAAMGVALVYRTRTGHLAPPAARPRMLLRRSLLHGVGVLAAAWLPLLAFGAAGLSPLSDGVVARGPDRAVEHSARADVARPFSARKRVVDSPRDEPVPEASVAPIADGSDGSSPALSSSTEGASAVASPSLPEDELVEQAPEYGAAPGGDAPGTATVPSTGGVAAPSK